MDPLKAKAISARIVALMQAGADLRTAYDAVMGAGAYDALASELYESLRRKYRAEVR